MSVPRPQVIAYFELDAQGGDFFTLDDPVKGVLDNVTYPLAGAVATDISDYVRGTSIRRGRARRLDEITAGVATIECENLDRLFDPEYVDGDFYGNLLPGRRVTILASDVVVFDGNIDDWDFREEAWGDSSVTFEVVDALAALAGKEFDDWTATPGQLPGARINAVLDREEVNFPAGQRDIDTGTSTLQGDNVSWGSNVLNYLQLITRSDLGVLFASRDNTITFYGRNRPVTGVDAPLFADDGTGYGYVDLSRARGTELLFNRVGVDAAGGIKQTVTDAASQDRYGVKSLTVSGLLLDTDDQSLQMANYLLALYKDPEPRIATLTVNLDWLTDAEHQDVLPLDIGSVVQVRYTPNRVGDPIDKFCMVEGISHRIIPFQHVIVLQLSNLADGFSGTPFVLDSAEFGVLDQNILGF